MVKYKRECLNEKAITKEKIEEIKRFQERDYQAKNEILAEALSNKQLITETNKYKQYVKAKGQYK